MGVCKAEWIDGNLFLCYDLCRFVKNVWKNVFYKWAGFIKACCMCLQTGRLNQNILPAPGLFALTFSRSGH